MKPFKTIERKDNLTRKEDGSVRLLQKSNHHMDRGASWQNSASVGHETTETIIWLLCAPAEAMKVMQDNFFTASVCNEDLWCHARCCLLRLSSLNEQTLSRSSFLHGVIAWSTQLTQSFTHLTRIVSHVASDFDCHFHLDNSICFGHGAHRCSDLLKSILLLSIQVCMKRHGPLKKAV